MKKWQSKMIITFLIVIIAVLLILVSFFIIKGNNAQSSLEYYCDYDYRDYIGNGCSNDEDCNILPNFRCDKSAWKCKLSSNIGPGEHLTQVSQEDCISLKGNWKSRITS